MDGWDGSLVHHKHLPGGLAEVQEKGTYPCKLTKLGEEKSIYYASARTEW